jgi:V-type H+-transporting ATPase subunit E
MKKLDEKAATVKCRQVDLVLVKEILETARKNFTALFQEEAPVLTLDQSSFLPPPPQANVDDSLSW